MDTQGVLECFSRALEHIHSISYDTKWVREVSLDTIGPQYFFEQYIWVVYGCNFKEANLKQLQSRLYRAYGDYQTLDGTRRDDVLDVIGNIRKWKAVYKTAVKMQFLGWEDFKHTYLTDIDSMTALGFVGPVTKFHLARNLGFNVAKPDRWMCRLAEIFECASVNSMCHYLAENYGLQLREVDLILWKYASDHGL